MIIFVISLIRVKKYLIKMFALRKGVTEFVNNCNMYMYIHYIFVMRSD